MLGRSDIVPGTWSPEQVGHATTGDDGIVQVVAPETVRSGPDQRMTLTITGAEGGAPTLGTYLGTYSHLTGFNIETGRFTHVHPYGEPEVGDDGTELTFHTEFSEPGRYVFFVQVRVDGFVHTVPVCHRPDRLWTAVHRASLRYWIAARLAGAGCRSPAIRADYPPVASATPMGRSHHVSTGAIQDGAFSRCLVSPLARTVSVEADRPARRREPCTAIRLQRELPHAGLMLRRIIVAVAVLRRPHRLPRNRRGR